MGRLDGTRTLIFVDDYYEDLELWYPRYRLEEEGSEVTIAGPEKGRTYKGKNGYPCTADGAIDDVRGEEYDILVLCGGFAPDKLRRIGRVLETTRSMHEQGKVVAMICHAGWVAISAGILRGYRVTSTPAIRDDLVNAGAEWVDEPVVVDRNVISSRRPDDLPQFCRTIIEKAGK
jgi:protease I